MTTPLLTQAVEAALRAETPFILFPDDLAIRLRLEATEAERLIREDCLGSWFTVDGVPAITRDSLRRHVERRSNSEDLPGRELLRASRSDEQGDDGGQSNG